MDKHRYNMYIMVQHRYTWISSDKRRLVHASEAIERRLHNFILPPQYRDLQIRPVAQARK